MKKQITCRYCLQPTAVHAVRGELADLYLCGHCGEGFEISHPRQHFQTAARPQPEVAELLRNIPRVTTASCMTAAVHTGGNAQC